MRRVSVFGATGSIGQSTLDLIGRAPEAYHVVALTGGRNVKKLAEDARRLNAEIAVTGYEACLPALKEALAGSGIEAAAGEQALLEAADRPTDWTMSAIFGAAGLAPGLRSLRHGGTLALANKESLVTAGPLLLSEAAKHGAKVLPVDSEHSAVFQALVGEDIAHVERVIITASGGALRSWPKEKLATATVADASAHPNWDMGQRITIDSASMFNKAMELIEAKEFFGFRPDQIEVLVHPQSLVHALVGFNDGALMAHVGPSDMRHAIGYALNWPERAHLPVERLDLAKIGQLDFAAPDFERWPALTLAHHVMERGGLSGTIFNAAKETALDLFIAGEIGFQDMARLVERVLQNFWAEEPSATNGHNNAVIPLENTLEYDQIARIRAREIAPELTAG
ncbi:1-deoxy-D-xylulose-5-phosphate reductoisomerase [Halocynthiibacter sp. C4]|uniref:1-deoxy-D-xylulose-5-phosphate reductoisomerase n=1 Tax=Halocynthiibacter sp. C4 TaxID=2992758 RepID=UPI00237C3022|nr:1-deoxy-D-xylulose-5-phosphate reductoisomerase [Halocynthiibacter sp. C4]MDE0589649.1 1-deoxy-D-xylulose-5-phosphate reductoisomerase [Halocynthiibacter sp. C4]